MAERIAWVLSVCLLVALPLGCTYTPQGKTAELEQQPMVLGALLSITLLDTKDAPLLEGCYALCQEYEALLGAYNPACDIARIHAAQGAPTQVDARTAALIGLGLQYSQMTQGAYDITMAPLTALWGFDTGDITVPDSAQLAVAASQVEWRNV